MTFSTVIVDIEYELDINVCYGLSNPLEFVSLRLALVGTSLS